MAAATAASRTTATTTKSSSSSGGPEFLLVIVVLFVLLYFLLIRPNQRRKMQAMRQTRSFGVGDEVVAGGMMGRVASLGDDEVGVEVSEGVVISFVPQAVQLRSAYLANQQRRSGGLFGGGMAGGGMGAGGGAGGRAGSAPGAFGAGSRVTGGPEVAAADEEGDEEWGPSVTSGLGEEANGGSGSSGAQFGTGEESGGAWPSTGGTGKDA